MAAERDKFDKLRSLLKKLDESARQMRQMRTEEEALRISTGSGVFPARRPRPDPGHSVAPGNPQDSSVCPHRRNQRNGQHRGHDGRGAFFGGVPDGAVHLALPGELPGADPDRGGNHTAGASGGNSRGRSGRRWTPFWRKEWKAPGIRGHDSRRLFGVFTAKLRYHSAGDGAGRRFDATNAIRPP